MPDEPRTAGQTAAEVGRLAIMLIMTVLLQTTIAPHIRILGSSPDFTVLAVVCVALLRGSAVGALFGFVVGACVAVAVFAPLGLSSFVLVLVGYFAGRHAETADMHSGWTPVLAALAGTVLAELLVALMQFLLDRETPVGFVMLHVLLPRTALNTLLAAPVFVLTRLWLREGVSTRARAT